ncbi:MAG TPA: aryl-sulfate sulfotransferase [Chitinophagales bacterium]|nr:aryl-sulfate sulfotransferase [Chitinophagales bacterium]
MKDKLTLLLFLASIIVVYATYGQIAPAIEWQKSLGGSANDYGNSIQQTTDGGYIVAGSTSSNDGDVSGNNGPGDFWVVKLDGSGSLIWQKCLGGSGGEQAYSIQQTTDGGFIVAGSTQSNDGNVSGNHTVVYAPTVDYWVVKLDVDGNLIWQKCLGGFGDDRGQSVEQTSDGGYIVAGYSDSNDGDVSGNHGLEDYWIVKLDSDGNLVWQKALGGSSNEYLQSIQQTTDGGFIVAGRTASNDGDVSGNHGNDDYWIVRLDTAGEIVWQKCLGGSIDDGAHSIQQTIDGGFIVGGSSSSNDSDVTANHGGGDDWIVKLDIVGNIVWQKSLSPAVSPPRDLCVGAGHGGRKTLRGYQHLQDVKIYISQIFTVGLI